MKKFLKRSAKKSFSLFMAVVMLMSAWVWVAPEKAGAANSAANYDSDVVEAFENWLKNGNTSYAGMATVDEIKPGSYFSGDEASKDYSGYYNNLIAANSTGNTHSGGSTTDGQIYAGLQQLYVDYPEMVLFHDGGNNTPKIPVSFTKDPSSNSQVVVYGATIQDFTMDGYWRTEGNGGYETPSFYKPYNGGNVSAAMGSLTKDSTINYNGGTDEWATFANTASYSRNDFGNTEYVRTVDPQFQYLITVRNGCKGSVQEKKSSIDCSRNIYLINVKPWNQAVFEAIAVYNQIATKGESAYTAASVTAFKNAARALLAGNPNNASWTSDLSASVKSWESSVKTAINAWNSFGDLVLRPYYVKFVDTDGTTEIKSFDYVAGESFTVQSLIANNSNLTLKADDLETNHQLYKWVVESGIALGTTIKVGTTSFGDDDILTITKTKDKTENHSYGDYTKTDATNHYQYCSVCNHELPTIHNFETVNAGEDVLCSDDNKVTKTCYDCGEVVTSSQKHDIQHEEKYEISSTVTEAPTCSTTGLRDVTYKCKNCSYTEFVEDVEIPTLPHTYNEGKYAVVNPTCDTAGSKTPLCDVCETPDLTQQEELAPFYHTKDGNLMYEAVVTPPTCTKEGYTTHTCSLCGHVKVDTIVPALNHKDADDNSTYVGVVTAPTCTEKGYTTYTCSQCGDSYTADEVKENGHTAGEAVKENEVAATCRLDGSYDSVVYCTVCKEELSRDTIIDKATGEHVYVGKSNGDGTHTYYCGCGESNGVTEKCSGGEATCQAKAVCSECKAEYGEKAAHKYEIEAAEEGYLASVATCQASAKYYYSCSWCGKSSEGDTDATFDFGAPLPHTYIEKAEEAYIATPATCQEIATYYTSCSACGTSSKGTDDEATFAYGELGDHVYDKEVNKKAYLASTATCQTPATYYKSCFCGESSQGKGDKEVTFEYGSTVACAYTKAEPVYDKENNVLNLATEATCTAKAKYYYVCTWCNGMPEDEAARRTFRYGDFAEHTYEAVQKAAYAVEGNAATCISGGKYYESCSACGAKGTEIFDGVALDHVVATNIVKVDPTDKNVYPATCSSDGYYKIVTSCVRYSDPTGKCNHGEKFDYVKIPATGKHAYGDWVVTTPATCGKAGEKVRTCTTCPEDNAAKLTEVIPATGEHVYIVNEDGEIIWTTDVLDAATCQKEGREYSTCKDCGYKNYRKTAVVGHAWLEPVVTKDDKGNVTDINYHYDREISIATCMQPAVYYKHCATCGTTMGGETYVDTWGGVDADNHSFGGEKIEVKNADGVVTGYVYACQNVDKDGNKCTATSESECGFKEIYDADNNIILGNADAVVASTCKTNGSATFYCISCGESHKQVITLELDPAKHESDEVIYVGGYDAYCDKAGHTGAAYYACCYKVGDNAESASYKNEGQVIGTEFATNHNPDRIETVEAKTATCTEDGWEAYTVCKDCPLNGDKDFMITEKVTVGKTGHDYTGAAWTQVVEDGKEYHSRKCNNCDVTEKFACSGYTVANCVDKATCKTCGNAYGEVNATNHKSVTTVREVEATCQKVGYEAYMYCDACEKIVDANGNETVKVEIPVVAHDFDGVAWTTDIDAETGVQYHTRNCKNCVEANGEVACEKADCTGGTATCTSKAVCSTCSAEYGELDATNHASDEVIVIGAVEATCSAEGYTGDKYHACCYNSDEGADNTNALIERGTQEPTLDHDFTKDVASSKIAATCKTPGSVLKECSVCGEDAAERTALPIDPENHESDIVVVVNKKAATCTTEGYTGDKYHECCYDGTKPEKDNKNALIEKGSVIETNGSHKYSKPVAEYELALDDEGKVQFVEEFDEDGKLVSRTLKRKEGTISYEDKVAARHADNKWYHVVFCTECKDVVYTACASFTNAANCVETDKCAVCNGLCSLVAPNNHKEKLEVVEGKAATCIADGVKDYYKCKHCNETYFDAAGKNALDLNDEDDLAALAISMSTVAHTIDWNNPDSKTEGDCGHSGVETYKCKVEGCNYKAEKETGIVSGKHTWPVDEAGNYIYTQTDEPTCGTVGFKAVLCDVCGTVKLNSYVSIPATGNHTYGDPEVIEGTDCLSPTQKIYTCTEPNCGHKKYETDTTGVSAHVWTVEENDGWYPASGDCSSGVTYERKCSKCSYSETQVAAGGVHALVVKIKVEPTKETDGYVIYECASCGYEMREDLKYNGDDVEEDEIHIIDDKQYTIRKEATCKRNEVRRYICLDCGKTIEREVPGTKLPHEYLPQSAEKATCDRVGHSEYEKCVVCEETRGYIEYEALGHEDGNGDGKCDRCKAVFYGDGSQTCSCMCHKSGFMGFIYKIVRIFWKLFKIGHSCECGATHY